MPTEYGSHVLGMYNKFHGLVQLSFISWGSPHSQISAAFHLLRTDWLLSQL